MTDRHTVQHHRLWHEIREALPRVAGIQRKDPRGYRFVGIQRHHIPIQLFQFRDIFSLSFSLSLITHGCAVATQHVEKMNANLGGTNILQPLKAIFAEPPKPGIPRQVPLYYFCIGRSIIANASVQRGCVCICVCVPVLLIPRRSSS
jgi:hypothetical protein